MSLKQDYKLLERQEDKLNNTMELLVLLNQFLLTKELVLSIKELELRG
jgi:hypothetical protein